RRRLRSTRQEALAMPDKKDTSEPSFRGVVLVLLAVVTVTLVVRSLLVDNDPVASAFVHQRPIDFSATDPASPKAHQSPHRPSHQQGSAPFHLAAAPKPIAKLSRHCLQATHNGFLTVVSYNIRSGHGPAAPHGPGDEQLGLVTQAIKLWGADVVLLQEVDVNRALSGFVNIPKVLADALGWHYAFGANVVRPGNSQYGTAILSRYPIVEQSNTPLPNRPGMQQRGLLHVVIAPHGHQISLYDTHLQNTSSSMRDAQMRAIAPILAADPLPLVLGGDLNSFPGSQVVSIA